MIDKGKRALVTVATVLFGIVPASVALLSNALFLISVNTGPPPEGVTVAVSWPDLAALLLTVVAALVGYVALFFAARLKVNGKIVGCLLVGVAVVAHELLSAQHEALIVGVLLLPAIVALVHVIAYFVRERASALTT